MMNTILKSYNALGDDFYYHHTRSAPSGTQYSSGPESHRQYEILYLIDGSISYIIEGETYKVSAGDIILVSPNEIHTLKIKENTSYERAVILFSLEIIEGLLEDGKKYRLFENERKMPRVINKESAQRYGLGEQIMSIVESEDDEPYKRLHSISKLIEFIISLDKVLKKPIPDIKAPYTKDALIARVIELIDENIRRPISLDALAGELFVSKSTLCHRFSSYMHITPGRYITTKKMQLAQRLLQDGMGAQEVCRELGYDNYTTFYYNYKQIIGSSPALTEKKES